MTRRLIEEAFPLKKVSEDSKHEQYVNYGKPNNLHFWPARRVRWLRAVLPSLSY